MTQREEEILKKAKEEAWHIADTSQTKEEAVISGYCLGAKYANKTMIVRACEWLKSRISVDAPIETNENGEPLAGSWLDVQMERMKLAEEFIDDFRQAMEEENKKV